MKISKSTIIRTILVAIVIINFILEKLGVDLIPVDESIIGMFVETFIEIAVIVVGFWKNNSFSQAAIRADEFLKELRNDDAEWEGEIEAEDPIEKIPTALSTTPPRSVTADPKRWMWTRWPRWSASCGCAACTSWPRFPPTGITSSA